MGFNKLNRWVKSKIHGYNLVDLVKSKPWKIKSTDRICILAPHPDDEVIGCGGLLIKHASQCDVVLLTDGSKGGDTEIRAKEFEKVMALLKIKNYQMLGAKDTALIDGYDLFKQIDFSKYDYVVMPHAHDSHKDHIVPQAFFKRLCKENSKINAKAVYYEVWAPIDMPNLYLDISEVAEKKKELINFYASQVGTIDYASRILALNHYRGIRHFVEFEEDYLLSE